MMLNAAQIILDEYYNEIKYNLNSSMASSELEQKIEQDKTKGIIIGTVIGYANSIMDSYGTGSKIDLSSPYLEDYRNSSYWNPYRYDTAIRKRPKGTYINIYGEIAESDGRGAGYNLEHLEGYEPIAPSKAFQNAEIWFIKGNKVKMILDRELKKFYSSCSKYFVYRK